VPVLSVPVAVVSEPELLQEAINKPAARKAKAIFFILVCFFSEVKIIKVFENNSG
jgi:hypothetical protein